eukprot:4542716-Pyramimonas_sp.AAC.1
MAQSAHVNDVYEQKRHVDTANSIGMCVCAVGPARGRAGGGGARGAGAQAVPSGTLCCRRHEADRVHLRRCCVSGAYVVVVEVESQ